MNVAARAREMTRFTVIRRNKVTRVVQLSRERRRSQRKKKEEKKVSRSCVRMRSLAESVSRGDYNLSLERSEREKFLYEGEEKPHSRQQRW